MPKKPHITLVENSSESLAQTSSAKSTVKGGNPVVVTELRSALQILLPDAGHLVPSDVAILQTLWPLAGEAPVASDLQLALAELLENREFSQVFVGREAHLTRVTEAKNGATWHTVEQTITRQAEAMPDEDSNFDLRVALDIETERQLLFRVLVVLESIGALLLAREIALWWVGL